MKKIKVYLQSEQQAKDYLADVKKLKPSNDQYVIFVKGEYWALVYYHREDGEWYGNY